jgi:two-component system, cell cycle sensor histidine kinase and response regulator CckA
MELSAEAALNLLEWSPDACVLLATDGTFRYVNARAEELLDRKREDLLGRDAFEVFPEAIETAFRSNFERVLKGARIHFEEYLAPINSWLEVDTSLGPEGVWVWFRDVSAIRSVQVELERRERLLQTIVDNQPECVKLVARDGTLVEMNEAGLQMIEAESIAEVRGQRIVDVVVPEHRDAFQQLHDRVFEGEGGTLEFDLVGLKGTRRAMDTTAAPLRDDSGRIVAHLGVTRDVTARRRLEEQLRHANKMEAIGRLAGGIAHDFNNLLMAIMGYGESIHVAGGDTADEAREILRAADRAADLVRQLLAFSRRQILETTVLDLNAIVRDAERMIARTIGDDIDVMTVLAGDVRPVRADAGQLQQVLLNLAVNARDAMPGGGVLSFETRNVELQENGQAPGGSYVQLTVTDTGEGMTADVRPQIFDPFFTTKPAGQGTGLGLATVYGIVEQSGGHITVYSEPGLGTSFKIFLPASRERVAEVESVDEPAPERSATETVLLVEDEAVVRRLVREILERDGYNVLEAADAEQAIAASEEASDIDLLLTDVVMPRMSGPEVAKSVSSSRDGLKVLYMSGYSDAAVVQRGLLEPGTAFIQKPFRAQELTEKIRTLLEA